MPYYFFSRSQWLEHKAFGRQRGFCLINGIAYEYTDSSSSPGHPDPDRYPDMEDLGYGGYLSHEAPEGISVVSYETRYPEEKTP